MSTLFKILFSLTLVIIGVVTGVFGIFELNEPGNFINGAGIAHPTMLAVFILISGFGVAAQSLVYAVGLITNTIDEAEKYG